ncbi:hypothetical protein D5086_006134, partial [Populus alba]
LRSPIIKTEELDLSANRFNNDKSILSCFNGNLSTLKSLDLSGTGLTAGSGLKVLSSRLKKLENLHLSGNKYNDKHFSISNWIFIPQVFGSVSQSADRIYQ